MQLPSGWELIIILVIIVLLFGPGRIGKVAGEIGRGIREFRTGLRGDDEDEAGQETISDQDMKM